MIRIGTCSWAEKTLIESGEFYPREAKSAEARLRYYASYFDTVEVDSTYYAIPDQRTAWLWDARTPAGFTFHIKVYGALTGHPVERRALPADLRASLESDAASERSVYIKDAGLLKVVAQRFAESLLPLTRAGKLGLMLFQFPPWFHYGSAGKEYILFCKELMGGLPLAVEFRHGSWLSARSRSDTLDFLHGNGLTYVAADEPQYGNFSTIPFIPSVTTDTAYFRFHGRNTDNWLKKNIETSLRFAYRYSDAELQEFTPAIAAADGQAKTTYVMFNNCFRGSAVANAQRLKTLLGEAGSVS